MHTLGYSFKPWRDAKAIADGPAILDYVKETARRVRRRSSTSATGTWRRRPSWSSEDAAWTVEASARTPARPCAFTCNFLFMCAGYYSYREGYTPEFPGRERLPRHVVHPQKWPEDLDYRGKRVVVIGSGATAMTLVPAIARTPATRTMLQRSPTYVVSRPDADVIANALRKVLPDALGLRDHALEERRAAAVLLRPHAHASRRRSSRSCSRWCAKELGPDYDVDTHFTPSYNPWDQRLCLVPNSDLFEAIRSGKASVVTDQIERFTETGIRLASGNDARRRHHRHRDRPEPRRCSARCSSSSTAQPVDFAQTWTYKGMMYSDVPNLRLHVRLHQRLVDAARRPHVRVRLPRCCNHMDATGTTRSARRACARPTRHAAAAVDRRASRPATCSG